MDRTKARRRRLAFGVLIGLAIAAFALGAALGDGRPPEEVEVASTLPAPQLAGQRLVAGLGDNEVTPRLRAAVREGRIAGVVLFAANFPTRRAGRELIARLQAIRRPPALRDPLLIMVDQEGGLVKRVGGAPSGSAQEMGNRGAAYSREQGRLTARNLRDLGVNVDLAPVLDVARQGRDDRRHRTRLRRQRREGDRDRGPLRRRPAGGWGGGDRQALPRLWRRRRKHRLRGRRDRSLEGTAAGGGRGPLSRLYRGRRRPGDAQHRDLPGLLREAGCLRAADRHRRAARAGSASRASRSPTPSAPSPCATSAARPRRAWRRPEPAPTSSSSTTSAKPKQPGKPS